VLAEDLVVAGWRRVAGGAGADFDRAVDVGALDENGDLGAEADAENEDERQRESNGPAHRRAAIV
jgi:hypothetical protein